MKLGDVVTITGAYIHAGGPYVVVHEPLHGRVQLCRRGSRRWFMPEWHAVDEVSATCDGKDARCARKVIASVKPDPDGWKRILVGRPPGVRTVIVGHVSLTPAHNNLGGRTP